jgi:hypothetical protein
MYGPGAVARSATVQVGRRQTVAGGWIDGGHVPVPIILFIASLLWPVSIFPVLGGINFPIYRSYLLVLMPLAAVEIYRRGIALKTPDYVFLFFAPLLTLSLSLHYGLTSSFSVVLPLGKIISTNVLVNAGATIIETLGSYFAARAFLRTRADVIATVRLLILIAIAVGAITTVESTTGFSIFGSKVDPGFNRLGLYRAQGPFPHPILWGLFAASTFAFAMAKGVIGTGVVPRAVASALLIWAVVTSVSSAAFAAIGMQVLLIAWYSLSRNIAHRGLYFAVAFTALYLMIDLFSHRTPLMVLISYTALNEQTGYYRYLIWLFGWPDFLASPIIGIGYHDWARPIWMTPSIDAFWLVLLLRYGLLAIGPFIIGIATSLGKAVRALPPLGSGGELDLIYYWLASLISLLVAGFTVHFWGQSYVELLFLLGMWGALIKGTVLPRAADKSRAGQETPVRVNRHSDAMRGRRVTAQP